MHLIQPVHFWNVSKPVMVGNVSEVTSLCTLKEVT